MSEIRRPGGWAASLSKAIAVGRLLGANQFAYPGEVLAKQVFLVTQMFIFTSLWRAIAAHHDLGEKTGMTIAQLVWYLAFTESIYMSFNPLPDGMPVDREVRSGDIAYRLARPMGYASYHLAAHLGERAAAFVLTLMVTGVIAFVLVGWPGLDPLCVLAAVAAALLGFFADAAWMYAIAFLSFWIEDTYGLHLLYRRCLLLLGGLLAPIEAYPAWLRAISERLPFRLILDGPGRLFVARSADPFFELAFLQLSFGAAGMVLLCLGYRAGLRQVASQGG